MRLFRHIDEIHHHDAADIPQAHLPRDFPRRCQIDAENGVFEAFISDKTARVHVHHGHGFRVVDDEIRAVFQRYHGLSRGKHQRRNAIFPHHRALARIQNEFAFGKIPAQTDEGQKAFVQFLVPYVHGRNVVAHAVAHDADGQIEILIKDAAHGRFCGVIAHGAVEIFEIFGFPFELSSGNKRSLRADDKALAVLFPHLIRRKNEVLSKLLVLDFSGNTHKIGIRKKNKVFSDERKVCRDLRALISARRLCDLNDNFVPFFQIQGTGFRNAERAVVFGIIGISFVRGQIAVAFQSAGNKRRLHAGKHVHNAPLIDIAHDFAARFLFRSEFRKLSVFQERDELLTAVAVEKPFLLHVYISEPSNFLHC